ncbi:hypothetical protein LZ30DRAFT_716390 [Colletotrichum cereale]|nr:hypothetical protein LZ30DRAFT_716390 [Colletotrichum cereale]
MTWRHAVRPALALPFSLLLPDVRLYSMYMTAANPLYPVRHRPRRMHNNHLGQHPQHPDCQARNGCEMFVSDRRRRMSHRVTRAGWFLVGAVDKGYSYLITQHIGTKSWPLSVTEVPISTGYYTTSMHHPPPPNPLSIPVHICLSPSLALTQRTIHDPGAPFPTQPWSWSSQSQRPSLNPRRPNLAVLPCCARRETRSLRKQRH